MWKIFVLLHVILVWASEHSPFENEHLDCSMDEIDDILKMPQKLSIVTLYRDDEEHHVPGLLDMIRESIGENKDYYTVATYNCQMDE